MRHKFIAIAATVLLAGVIAAGISIGNAGAGVSEENIQVAAAMTFAPVTLEVQETYAPVMVTTAPSLPTFEDMWSDEAAYIAKTLYGEALVCSTTERAAVAWCILNRVDSNDSFYADDIISVVTQYKQFHGYNEEHPVLPELYDLAMDVLERWQAEKRGNTNVGRVLPQEYLFFSGDGRHNTFRTEWNGGEVWDWSLDSPYEE